LPVIIPDASPETSMSFLETSENIIVEAMRREEDQIELRSVECLGLPGTVLVKVSLPHRKVHITDLTGRKKTTLSHAESYSIPVQPREIVTLHLETTQVLPVPDQGRRI
jgi:alpha-mannosidase